MDLVSDFGVQWNPMGHVYEHIRLPGCSFDVPTGMAEFEARLVEKFPEEKLAIQKYFRDVKKAQHWVAGWFMSKLFPRWIAKLANSFGQKLATMTTEDYLKCFRSEELRSLLAAQWPDFGSPPQESAFGFHATVSADFFDGGFYPIGGSKMIAKSVARVVESRGGKCLVNHEVQEILIREGRAVGVKAIHKGKEVVFYAPKIISNAGAIATFRKMVPEPYCTKERSATKRVKPGISAIIAFVGLKDDPRKHGFDDANYWVYSRLDHDIQARVRDGEPDRIDGVFVSFGSLRDPDQSNHTAQIISFSNADSWSQSQATKWMQRGEEYETRKEVILNSMIEYAEQSLPGLRDLIEYAELSTPLTVESFTGHAHGAVYGQPCDASRLTDSEWRIETSVKDLFLTGSDVGTPGVNGALMAGVMTAAKILGPLGLIRIFARAFLSKPKSASNLVQSSKSSAPALSPPTAGT